MCKRLYHVHIVLTILTYCAIIALERGETMAKVSTNISLDAEDKAKAQEFLAAVGMDLSTAVGVFIKQMLREGKIPFEIKADCPNSLTEREMREAEKGEGMIGPFHSIEALMDDLNA